MNLFNIQPSQLYINELKLNKVLEWFEEENYESLPIKKINDELIFTDGHTRAYIAYLKGLKEIKVYWDEDKIDEEGCLEFVRLCKADNIFYIKDLKGKVLSNENYQKLWIDRCKHIFK